MIKIDGMTVLNIASGIIAAKYRISPLTAIGLGLALDFVNPKARHSAITGLALYFAAYGVGVTHEMVHRELRKPPQ
jgi:hypothetical protein